MKQLYKIALGVIAVIAVITGVSQYQKSEARKECVAQLDVVQTVKDCAAQYSHLSGEEKKEHLEVCTARKYGGKEIVNKLLSSTEEQSKYLQLCMAKRGY